MDKKYNIKFFVSCREQALKATGSGMEKWQKTAEQAWAAILSQVEHLKGDGKTLQEIADIVGARSRSVIGEWLNKNRKAVNAPFADLMSYLERLGIDYADLFPEREQHIHHHSIACSKQLNERKETGIDLLRKENSQLQAENQVLRLELEKANAVATALREIVQQHMSTSSGQDLREPQDKNMKKSA